MIFDERVRHGYAALSGLEFYIRFPTAYAGGLDNFAVRA